MDRLPTGLAAIGQDGRLSWVSHEFEEILGRLGVTNLNERPYIDLVTALLEQAQIDDARLDKAFLRAREELLQAERDDSYLIRARGEWALQFTCKPTPGLGYLLSLSDLTDVERRETMLDYAELTSRSAAWRLNLTTNEIFFSEGAWAVFGPGSREKMARLDQWVSFVHPDDRDRMVATVTASLRNLTPYACEYRVYRTDGALIEIAARGDFIYDGSDNPRWAQGIFQDVTELRESQRALKSSEARFRAIVDNNPDIITILDENGRITFASRAVSTLLGYDIADVIGLTFAEFVHEDDLPKAMQAIERVLTIAGHSEQIELKVHHKDGTWLDLEVVGRSLPEDTTVSGIVINTRDVSSRMEAERQLRQSQKLEAVGQLTGGVAHDFNNLLMIILGNVELLAMSHLGEEDAKTLATIAQAAESAAQLTRQLLTFARQTQLNRSRVDVAELVSDTVPLLRAGLPETIRFSQSLTPDLWSVDVDANSLQQALVNLAMNARDSMLRGGEIVVACHNLEVDEDMVPATTDLRPGRYVTICVSDTGEGMSPEVLARALEPFFTTKDVGKGTGLGLSTVYGFAKQSNGGVSIYSEPGRGTTVKLYLPAAEGDAPEDNHPEPAIAAAMPKPCQRILVVEDQPQVRVHVEKTLARLGYAVETAQDAASALAMLKQGEAFDLLFTDIIMPGGMNGQELGEAALLIAPQLKILYTSGYPAAAFEHLGLKEQSSINFLSKPYKASQLQTMLAEILDDQS